MAMDIPLFDWDWPDDEEGNVQDVLENGITQDEGEDVFADRNQKHELDPVASGAWTTRGHARTGRYLVVFWDRVIGDPWTIRPISARLIQPSTEAKHGPA
jgi:uncharacterized DUF497 family protein